MMNNPHILNLLEEDSLRHLSDAQRLTIETHTANCSDCLNAYQAAQVLADLLHHRAGETLAPSPFFQTRLMAALRQQQAEKLWSFGAMWQMARTLIVSMVMVVVLLTALNLFGKPASAGYEGEAADNLYSAERIILDGSNADNLTDGEVLTTLYESGAGYGDFK